MVKQVAGAADLKAFVELPYRLYAGNPNWVPPLKDEVYALLTPGKNPWFQHGEAQYFLALRGGRVVGRISAHLDHLALTQPPEQGMGPGTGFWGLFEGEDSEIFAALISAAEEWLKTKGMNRSMGPVSLSMWDEPGLLVSGHDHPPTVMMGYNSAAYEPWVDAAGYKGVEDLYTYALKIDDGFPELTNRIVAMGEKSGRIRIRKVDKSRFDAEAALIIGILNDAWSQNWGFVPFTDAEIAYAGKKLKPLVYEDLIRVAEMDGEPVAFMMTIPNINEKLIGYGGSLWPLNWAKLLWWLRRPKARIVRVPLMGVVQKLQGSRMASQLAFMLIEYIRRDAIARYGTTHGEFGWVLSSNGPMRSVGEAVGGKVNKIYRIFERSI
ncbi:MAG: N-acetyltransferase [Sphingomonadales bacterium]|nr:N-acetyltransferase [Sphingomonadales bacterium]